MGLFSENLPEDKPPLIYTKSGSVEKNGSNFSSFAEVIDFPGEELDISKILEDILKQNGKIVVCEGGPTLNSKLLTAGLIDEFCMSISPRAVGGETFPLLLEQAVDSPTELSLDRVLFEDEFLFCRYLTIR